MSIDVLDLWRAEPRRFPPVHGDPANRLSGAGALSRTGHSFEDSWDRIGDANEPTATLPDSCPPACLLVHIGLRYRVRDGVVERTEGRRRFGSQKSNKNARGNERHQEAQ